MSLEAELQRFTALADSVVAKLGMVLVDVRFGQMGNKRSLEVTIFRPGGRIALEDCESVSRALDKELEEQQPPVMSGSYLLEVQSPGIERQLKTEREFRVFAGQTVEVVAKVTVGQLGSSFVGTLQGLSQARLSISNPKPLQGKLAAKSGAKAKTSGKSLATIVASPLEKVEIELDKVVRVKLHAENPKILNTEKSPDLEGAELSGSELS